MFIMILAVIGGVLTTLSMVINSSLGKRIGVLQGTFINYIVGLVCSLLVLMFIGTSINVNVNTLRQMPFYIFLGGAIGVVVVFSSNIVIPRIPVVYSTLLLFIGQILAGIIIDFIITKEFSNGKILGSIIIILGILYNSSVDKKVVDK